MIPDRFPDEINALDDRLASQPQAGFLMVPVAAPDFAPASPLQSLYQQMYQQAVCANQQPKARDLFAVMN
jgi:chromosomal replication initiation ATPase DnaA